MTFQIFFQFFFSILKQIIIVYPLLWSELVTMMMIDMTKFCGLCENVSLQQVQCARQTPWGPSKSSSATAAVGRVVFSSFMGACQSVN